MTDQMNVPKLRFGEFNEALVRKTLEEVTEKIQDGTHFSPPLDEEGTCLYLTSKNIRNGFMLLDDISYISELEHKKIYKRCDVKKGDVLLTKDGASTGNCCINTLDSEFSLLSSVAFIRANANHHNDFIYQSIVSQAGQKLIRGSISGQAITRITLTKLRNFKFYFPTLPEQQKIASFLSKVDEKIALLTKKKDKLTEYKKGVMQQLFNSKWDEQDGQLTFTPPTLRFKADDGSEFPVWEEKKLGDLTKPVKRKATDTVSKVMTISASQGFLDQKERFSQVIAGSSLDRYTHIKKGEFSYNRGNSKTFKYGCIYMMREDEALVPFVYRTFKLTSGIPEFYQQLFLNHVLDRQLRKMISSSARMDGLLNIGEKDFYKVKLLVPSIGEQTKIANFLSAIDQKIDLANSELEKAKEWKKGLLQQMFV
ncbi:restriction endonuclease subunit S [Photobacterium damselae]